MQLEGMHIWKIKAGEKRLFVFVYNFNLPKIIWKRETIQGCRGTFVIVAYYPRQKTNPCT